MTIEQELKEELRQLALTDFDKFLQVTGVDLKTLEICKRRKKGNSLRQIAIAMQMPYRTIGDRCKQCGD